MDSEQLYQPADRADLELDILAVRPDSKTGFYDWRVYPMRNSFPGKAPDSS